MIHRHLIFRALVTAVTAAAVGASAASAMPRHDAGSSAAKTHHSVARNPALIDAAAHAATMRAIGAKRAARACG
jgi:hypothetical protein